MFQKFLFLLCFRSACLNCGSLDTVSMNHLCDSCLEDIFKILPSAKNNQKNNINFCYMLNDSLKELFYLYKFQGLKSAEKDLYKILAPFFEKYRNNIFVIVPCSQKTKNHLGFHPVEKIVKHFNIIPYPILKRNPKSLEQKHLSKKERSQQHDLFFIDTNAVKDIMDKEIILLDDVCTTGHSLKTANDLLKNNGLHFITPYCFFKEHQEWL